MNLLLSNKNQRFTRQFRDSFSGADGSQQATLDKLKDLYSKSGSNKTFAQWLDDLKKAQNVKKDTPILDWLTSDNAKNTLVKAQSLVDMYNQNKNGNMSANVKSDSINTDNNNEQPQTNNGEVTLFGLHPITFAVGATVSLIAVYFLGRYLINLNHNKITNKNLKTT